MGWDSIAPFVTGDRSHNAAFVLCKTSNPSSKVISIFDPFILFYHSNFKLGVTRFKVG